jgi:hypothetical protein
MRFIKKKLNEDDVLHRDASDALDSVPGHRTIDPENPTKNRVGINYETVRAHSKKYNMDGREIYFLYSQF